MQNSVTLLIIIAILAANLPFATERIGGMVAVPHKHFGWRLLEVLLLYVVVGLFARLLESRLMPAHSQGWQFYVCTLALFLVFAFPGFVLRYFWTQRSR